MSRGGRGGRGGGAARLLRKTDSEAPKFYVRLKPETFPPTPTPITPPATLRERGAVARYRVFRDKMRKGPYYTVLGRNTRVNKPNPFSLLKKGGATNVVGKSDGFSSMWIHTDKYLNRAQTMPELKGMEWLKEYIPEELWSAVDPEVKKTEGLARRRRQRKAALNVAKMGEDGGEEEIEEEEEDPLDVEQDENWEDEEDEEMDYEEREKDDYNAEQYFDNGEDDDGAGDDEPGGGDYE